jgi:hypothetical protein
MNKWRNIVYQFKSGKKRIVQSALDLSFINIVVYRGIKGKIWHYECYALDTRELRMEARTPKEAKREAIEITKLRIKGITDRFNRYLKMKKNANGKRKRRRSNKKDDS